MTSLVLFLIAVGRVSDLWFLQYAATFAEFFLQAIVVQDVTVTGRVVIAAHPKADKVPVMPTADRG